jgi:hypothetical protein
VTGAMFCWGQYMAKAEKVFKENQSEGYPAPSCFAFAEGPIGSGRDIARGVAWYTVHGFLLASTADAADSLGVIDKLTTATLKLLYRSYEEAKEEFNWSKRWTLFDRRNLESPPRKYRTCGTQ